jgi:hypothetical protein
MGVCKIFTSLFMIPNALFNKTKESVQFQPSLVTSLNGLCNKLYFISSTVLVYLTSHNQPFNICENLEN